MQFFCIFEKKNPDPLLQSLFVMCEQLCPQLGGLFFCVDLVHFYVWKTELFVIDAVWWAEGSSCCWEDPEGCFLGCKRSKPCKQIITAIFCVCGYLVGYWNLIISLVHSFSKQLEKVNNQIAEAEAALEARKKPPEENGPKIVGEGLVIDEWVLPLSWHEIFWFHLVHVFCSVLRAIVPCVHCRKSGGKGTSRNSKLKWSIQCKLHSTAPQSICIWLQQGLWHSCKLLGFIVV